MESDGQLIYDDNSDNGFTIFINVKDGEVQSIENGYQMADKTLIEILWLLALLSELSPVFILIFKFLNKKYPATIKAPSNNSTATIESIITVADFF